MFYNKKSFVTFNNLIIRYYETFITFLVANASDKRNAVGVS